MFVILEDDELTEIAKRDIANTLLDVMEGLTCDPQTTLESAMRAPGGRAILTLLLKAYCVALGEAVTGD